MCTHTVHLYEFMSNAFRLHLGNKNNDGENKDRQTEREREKNDENALNYRIDIASHRMLFLLETDIGWCCAE